MSKLFTPIAAGSLSMPNRVVIAPMCQYSAEEGRMTDWHMIHLGQLALSGAGLLTIEATAVSPEGRITYADTGLWDDATEAAMVPVMQAIRRWSDIPVAIQLAHAGRKASTEKPWLGGAQIPPGRPNGWQTVAPSALPFASGENAPEALDKGGMDRIRDAFAEAGLITDYDHAESIVATGDADMVALARGILYDPRWPWHAAAHLGAQVRAAPQYLRCQPRAHRALFRDA